MIRGVSVVSFHVVVSVYAAPWPSRNRLCAYRPVRPIQGACTCQSTARSLTASIGITGVFVPRMPAAFDPRTGLSACTSRRTSMARSMTLQRGMPTTVESKFPAATGSRAPRNRHALSFLHLSKLSQSIQSAGRPIPREWRRVRRWAGQYWRACSLMSHPIPRKLGFTLLLESGTPI